MAKMGKIRKNLKAAAGILAALVAAGAVTAYAAEPQSGKTTVQYTKVYDSTFTLNIPATVTLSETEEVTETTGLSAIKVANDEKVQIKVASGITDGKVTLNDSAAGTSVSSTVSLDGTTAIGANEVVAEFEGTSTTPTIGGTLHFSAVGTDVDAGTYTGTITFEASIVKK